MDLALKIKKFRTDRGISQSQFARDIGISRGALINYEKGTRTPPIDVLITISKKFNIDIETLTSNDSYTYSLDNDEVMLLKEKNLANELINTEKESMKIEDLVNFLTASGYPTKDLTEEQIIELHRNAKQFFNYEFFKLGYIKISRD